MLQRHLHHHTYLPLLPLPHPQYLISTYHVHVDWLTAVLQ